MIMQSSSSLVNVGNQQRDDIEIIQQPSATLAEQEEEGNICIICQNAWSSEGEHCVAACTCGHLFGKSCISKWVQQNHSCPICKAKLNTHHIIPLFFSANTSEVFRIEMRRELSRENVELRKRFRAERTKRKQAESAFHAVKQKMEDYIAELESRCQVVVQEESEKPHQNNGNNSREAIVVLHELDDHDDSDDVVNTRHNMIVNVSDENKRTTEHDQFLNFLRGLRSEMNSYEIPIPFGVKNKNNASKQKKRLLINEERYGAVMSLCDQSKRQRRTIDNGGQDKDGDREFPSYVEKRSILMTRTTKIFDFVDPATIVCNYNNNISIYNILHSTTDDLIVSDNTVTHLLYNTKQRNLICTTMDEILFVDTKNRNVQGYLKVKHPISCITHFNDGSSYFAVGSTNGQIDIYDSRFNTCKSVSSLIVQNPIDKIQSISHIPFADKTSGLLVAKGKTHGNTFLCKSADNIDWDVAMLPLPTEGRPSVNYHTQYDPISQLCVSSYSSPATQTSRSIRHLIFPLSQTRSAFDASPMTQLTQHDQPPTPLPPLLQPNYFQRIGQQFIPDYYSSPTQLYTVKYHSNSQTSQPTFVLDDSSDDLHIVNDSDHSNTHQKTILAYTQFSSVKLIDPQTGSTIQVLPSQHKYNIENFKALEHPLGNFAGQLSRDRFTLFRLSDE